MRSVRRKKIHTLFFNNSKVKVRFMTLLFSLFVLVFGAITYFNTYSDMILDFKDDNFKKIESGIFATCKKWDNYNFDLAA